MTLNVQCIWKCVVGTARLTLTRPMLWLSELTTRDCMNVGLNCQRQWTVISQHWGLYEFSPGFTAEGRRTGVEPLILVRPIGLLTFMHHLLSDRPIFVVCGRRLYNFVIVICIIMKALNSFTKTDDLESKWCLKASLATYVCRAVC